MDGWITSRQATRGGGHFLTFPLDFTEIRSFIFALVFASLLMTGERDTGEHRQDTGQCGGSQEEAQCHSVGPANGRK